MTDNAPLAEVLQLLDLEPIEENVFRGTSPKDRVQRVFGGQVLGQALMAATRTVEGRNCHSFHAYFLRPGDPLVPILYEVDRSRDGASFSARRVVAIQHGQQIFTLAASFQVAETGFEHQSAMPDVPPPESLADEYEARLAELDRMPPPLRGWMRRPRPFEMRPLILDPWRGRAPRDPFQTLWLRTRGPLPDTVAVHQALLAYASDMSLIETSLLPHGKTLYSNVQIASLDHAMWFHRPFRADEWLLYVQDSPSASGARGFSRGTIFARDGTLVASVAQEGLIRPRPE